MPKVSAQPLLCVRDVAAASRWYQTVLGALSGHGGDEYEQLLVDGVLILQLHTFEVDHHHQALGSSALPLGNGVAVWFEVEDLDSLLARCRACEAHVVKDVHVSPNAGHREIWLRDLDGYLVVCAGS